MSSPVALSAMRRWLPSVLAMSCLAGALLPQRSVASDVPSSWGGSIAVTSDYRVRGISQTRGEPAVQGGLHFRSNSGWMAGVWASTIDRARGPSATSEIDAFLGFAWTLAPDWDARISLTHYWYPNDPARTRYDYDEISASIAYRAQLVATISFSPNTAYFGYHERRWQAERGASTSYELTGMHPLTSSLSLTGGVGYNDLSRLFDRGYWYWNAGIAYAMGSVRLDLSRIDSDGAAERLFGYAATDSGWSAAISWRF
jgi:uncharacterized protein (TIGR02001 family)